MHSRAILLRLLLCLVLVANGTTAAFANVRMAMMDSAAATQQDDAPPCHDMQADDAATMEHATPSPDSHGDCCGSACLCDCLAHATAFFLTVDALELAARPAAPPVSAPQQSRAAPALPHPIRPPIG